MCHAVPTAASARQCNGNPPHRGAAWQEGRLLLLAGGGVINYLALCHTHGFLNIINNIMLFRVNTAQLYVVVSATHLHTG